MSWSKALKCFMSLEHVWREPTNRRFKTPLLFVHGAWHGAWCWDQGFLEYCAERGFSAHALSLRGHGSSDGRERLRTTRISDYVDDVKTVAAKLDHTPIIIGHSMGGAIVQQYLESEAAVAGVLMASVPVSGVFASLARTHLRHPLLSLKMHFTLSVYPIVKNMDIAREMFFSKDIPREKLQRFHALLQDESYCAFLDMLILNLPKSARVSVPMLVLGAEDDNLFRPNEVRATAAAYGTEAIMFPNMAHDMMLEPGWRAVADEILDWASCISAKA